MTYKVDVIFLVDELCRDRTDDKDKLGLRS